ncbi:MAG: beta-N-acetylhexosaminidase, partial [Lentisphaerae bacterium]|nr:beta-N-acetylhexosaminidase [Lentisphaerota bacterium]
RGLGALLAGLVPADQPFEQELPFRTCGIMLECSRNAVSQVAYLKQWLRRMALLGYNWVMLYTKDIYELPAEPYFGYLRGRYTLAEIQELDAYAAALGIEMSACLQALGHLEPVLKWPAYAMIRDTSSVMMVGKEESYQLVEKMIQFWSRALRSRRIHVGLDETHDLGRGRYLDLHGYRRGFDLFNTHLRRVVRICRSYDLQPMIWSDMYFRLGSRNMDYYDPQSRIPQDVVRRIPRQVNLVYWDYYHADKNFYLEWIERHRRMGFEPVMASGIWTWGRLWHDASLTSANAGACLEACRQTGIRDVFFTMWGDDGNYCDFDSALAGLVFVAEKAITGQTRPAVLAKWLQAISGAQYKVTQMASQLNSIASGPAVLWDDPLLGIYLHNLRATRPAAWAKLDSRYRRLALQLAPWRQETGAGSIEHAWRLANLLALKTRLHRQLCTAYFNQDRRALSRIRRDIPAVMTALAEVADSFRTNWLRRYKPFGLEVLQIRLAGLQARLAELTDRLDDYQAGCIEVIEELEANHRAPRSNIAHPSYQNMAHTSYLL